MWYFSVSAELGDSPSWDEFKDKFLSRFQPIAAAKVARAQLRLLKQRHRVAGYSQEFMRLIQLIPDMNLADQIESYIVGLQNDLAIEVDKKEPQTLAEAMEFAQRIELMTTGRRQAYGRVPGLYNFSRSASSSSSNYHGGSSGDRMDLSAIRDADEAHDFHYGNEHPSVVVVVVGRLHTRQHGRAMCFTACSNVRLAVLGQDAVACVATDRAPTPVRPASSTSSVRTSTTSSLERASASNARPRVTSLATAPVRSQKTRRPGRVCSRRYHRFHSY